MLDGRQSQFHRMTHKDVEYGKRWESYVENGKLCCWLREPGEQPTSKCLGRFDLIYKNGKLDRFRAIQVGWIAAKHGPDLICGYDEGSAVS